MTKLPFEFYEAAAKKAASMGNPHLVEELINCYVNVNSAHFKEPMSTEEREKILRLYDQTIKIAREKQIEMLLERLQSPLEKILDLATPTQSTKGRNK